ncbi:unnamed protein product [Paramecium primaurelia]|uniref:TmcB/TmcC TPR repeats domain-containing protein n=1 Tax=Paramecium primaurelia TaxID=5886 RepID=A0A8S1JP67_PARPR|nr:unnamed protein product [Paramecium primaurelia]
MESKSNYNNAQTQLDNEGSFVDKLTLEMKQLIFKIVTLMLKIESQSVVFQLLMRLIQYMQLNAILFNRQIWKIWQVTTVSKPLHTFFNYFMITPYFDKDSFSYFVVLMYVCLSLFLITLMLICVIGFYSNKQNQSFTWAIAILRTLIEFFLSILFLPFVDVFLAMLACYDDGTGYFQHYLFDVQCWANAHIVHGIVAIIGVIIFSFITLLFSMVYYEVNYLPQNLNSKKQSKCTTYLLLYELVMVICYTYMNDKFYEYVHILIMLIGSFLVFWCFHVEKPYNNHIIQKSYSMLVTFHLWGVSMLCFAIYLEGVLFFGLIFSWMGGLPLLVITLLRPQNEQYEILMTNLTTCQQPQQIYNLTNFLLQLQYESQNDQTSGLVIDGFLDHHKITCIRDDCHLKLKGLPNYRRNKIGLNDSNLLERDIDLSIVLYQMYLNQTKKFQNCIKLRLRFAIYLYEKMKQKQNALIELQAIEQLFPKFDEEFIIYRFKKLIEDELNSNEGYGSFDIGNELQFQNNYKTLQRYIERSSLLHMDFWSLLQEDFPDLSKLNELGQKINNSIVQIEDLWKKMQKQSTNLTKALRLYGKFQIEVLQDKEQGEELLEKSRIIQQQVGLNRNKATSSFINAEDIGLEALPTIVIATTVDKFSQITNLNKACCNVLAYNKSELLNKKITLIMPNVFAKFHDRYIEKFMTLNVSSLFNVDRYIFVKQKHNYIMPSFLNIRMLQSYDDSTMIVGQFKLIKQFKPICYLLTDNEKIIESISASCFSLLGIDNKLITHNKIYINDLFPQFQDQFNSFFTKQGAPIKFYNSLQQTKSPSYQPSSEQQTEKQKSDKFYQIYQCNVSEIRDFEKQLVGYSIKLELIQTEKSFGTQQNMSLLAEKQQTEQLVYNQMQFKFIPKAMTFVAEVGNEINSQRVDQSVNWDQQDQSSQLTSNLGMEYQKPSTEKSDELQIFTHSLKLDDGIKTLRLFENKIQDIEDREDIISEDEDSGKSSVFQKIDNDSIEVGVNDNLNVFRSRTNLLQLINIQQTPKVITKLNWTMNLEMLSIVTLSFVAFFLTNQQYNKISDQLYLVQQVGIRNAEFFNLMAATQNLQMQQIGIWTFTSDSESELYEKDQRQLINDTINTINEINTILTLNSDDDNEQLKELYTQNVVNMQVSEGVFQKYDLVQAMQQLLSKSLILRDKQLAYMTPKDEDFKFLTYNLLNDFALHLQNSTQQYSLDLAQKTADNRQELISILGTSSGILGVSLLLLIFFLIQMAKGLQEILVLFLDIPDKTIKFLYSKCENFLSNIQIGEDDEMLSDFDELEKEEREELNRTLKQRRKKKKYKNSNKELRNLILISLILTILFQSYFIIFYFLSSQMLTNLSQMVPEINSTSYCEGFYKFAEGSERHLFLNRDIPITSVDSYYLLKVLIDALYQIDSYFHQEHSLNIDILNNIYIDSFQEIFMLQPCAIFASEMQTVTEEECIQFASGAIDQGMAVGLARFIENIRFLLTIYEQFYGHPEVSFSSAVRGNVIFKNITQNDDNVTNYIYNLNNFKQAKELRVMQSTYLKATFRYLFLKLKEGINLDMNNSKTQLLALFIIFEAILFILYFVFWLPLTIKLIRDIQKTRIMVMMIPLKVILKIRSIKLYIKDVILERAVEK